RQSDQPGCDQAGDELGLCRRQFTRADEIRERAMPLGDIEVSPFMPMEASGTPQIGNLTGAAALEALDPSTRGMVQAYIEGRSIPVGNARSPGVQYIKRLA